MKSINTNCLIRILSIGIPILSSFLFLANDSQALTLSNEDLQLYSNNNILFVSSCSTINTLTSNVGCGEPITGKDTKERRREMVEKYGIFFMNAQIEYGVPWEIPFVHAQVESHFGTDTNSVAQSVEKCGNYNWMGYKYGDVALFGLSESEMGNCKPYHKDGGVASQYKNIADMFMSFYTDFLRNGVYDSAYEYATPSNFSPRDFLWEETDKHGTCKESHYCGCGCGTGYVAVYDSIIDEIHKIAKEKGWPTSEELMKQYNIPKGGNWSKTWGNIKKHIDAKPHSLSVGCGSMSTLGDVSGVSFRNGNNSATPINTISNDVSSNPIPQASGGNYCARLGQERKAMWEAEPEEWSHFMYVVCGDEGKHSWGEDCSIAGVEGYMNQIVSKHGTNGKLSDWIRNQCPKFRGGTTCLGEHTITEEEQGWINEALKGSNNIRFAIGNATGGSGVGAGKIVCVWDGKKCRDDVDYTKEGGKGKCKVYTSSSDDECWGLETEEKWAEEMSQTCGSGCTTYEGEYPQYFQGDYSDTYYPCKSSPQNVKHCGCGPSSMAMLVTVATGSDVTPADIAKLTVDNPYNTGDRVRATQKVCEKYGCEAKEIYSTEEAMRQALKDGWMLHFSGKTPGGGNWSTNPFSNGGHYIGIFSIDENDDVMIADSANRGNGRTNRKMSLKDAIKNRHNAIMAIRGQGGVSCNNQGTDQCSGSVNAIVGEAAGIPKEKRMEYLFPNGTPTSESEMGQYLTTIEVPIINESGASTTHELTVHKKLAEEIKAVFQELTSVNNFRIKASNTGAYDWRFMASGTGKRSHHSYGAAIDLNSRDNPASYTSGTYKPGGNYYSVTEEVVAIWKKHGFYWGGDWSGHFRDYMHFTYTNH